MINPSAYTSTQIQTLNSQAVYLEVLSGESILSESGDCNSIDRPNTIVRPVHYEFNNDDWRTDSDCPPWGSAEDEETYLGLRASNNELLQCLKKTTTTKMLLLVKQFHQHEKCPDYYTFGYTEIENNNPPLKFIGTMLVNEEQSTLGDIDVGAKVLTRNRKNSNNHYTASDMTSMSLQEDSEAHLFVSYQEFDTAVKIGPQLRYIDPHNEYTNKITDQKLSNADSDVNGIATGTVVIVQAASQHIFGDGWECVDAGKSKMTLKRRKMSRTSPTIPTEVEEGSLCMSRHIGSYLLTMKKMTILEMIPVDCKTASYLKSPHEPMYVDRAKTRSKPSERK